MLGRMPSVLVVDDEGDICTIVTLALQHEGFEVRSVSRGQEALALLESAPPDVVILDIMMPDVDGFAVLAEVRRRRLAPDTRFIVATCRTSEPDHLRGWELGADDFVTKPFEVTELPDRVWDVLAATPAELAERRERELAKAALLDRLEAAMRRPSRASTGQRPGR